MKKFILTLALGLCCAVGFAQEYVIKDYVIVKQGNTETKYLLKGIDAINHSTDAVTIIQGDNAYTYQVADVDSIVFVNSQEEVMPDNPFDPFMPIYPGDTPPNIEGSYLVSTHVLEYSTLWYDTPGQSYVDQYIKFSNQDMVNNTVDYEAVQFASSTIRDYSLDSYVTGSDNNFTVFFNIAGEYSDGVTTYKMAYAISGTVGENGITNYYDGFILQEKNDPYDNMVPVGTMRIFKDRDGFSPRVTWPGMMLNGNNNDTTLPAIVDK